jgi:EAL and modified HD-GYP domain-containing signal transduction protein
MFSASAKHSASPALQKPSAFMSGSQFFLGRQPIVGRARELEAYELLFRSGSRNKAVISDDDSATAAVIQHTFSDLGMQSALGNKKGYINLSKTMLLSDLVFLLPPEQVVLEILETVTLSTDVLDRCRDLSQAGYRLALDDVVDINQAMVNILPFITVVKLDVLAIPPATLTDLVRQLHPSGVRLLAEKVETAEQYEHCRRLGFHLFQGYFFAKPEIVSGRSIQPAIITLLKVFNLASADADIEELESALKQEPDLTLRLLRMANSAAFGRMNKISTLRDAVKLIGRARLGHLVQIMMYAHRSQVSLATDPLVQTAVMRGRLMEGLAEALHWRALKDRAFMVGILSLVDALLGKPIGEILELLKLEDSLEAALLRREGDLGRLLQLVESSESQSGESTLSLMGDLGLANLDQFNRIQINALKWAGML